MRRVVNGLAVCLLLVPAVASANIGTYSTGYAYPVPWAPADGPLTLHYESGGSSSPPTFVIVDTLGEEVVRLTGERVYTGAVGSGDYDALAVFEVAWDGCNAGGRPVKAGTYLCYVQGHIFRFIVVR
jgi:hypothetical protein